MDKTKKRITATATATALLNQCGFKRMIFFFSSVGYTGDTVSSVSCIIADTVGSIVIGNVSKA